MLSYDKLIRNTLKPNGCNLHFYFIITFELQLTNSIYPGWVIFWFIFNKSEFPNQRAAAMRFYFMARVPAPSC